MNYKCIKYILRCLLFLLVFAGGSFDAGAQTKAQLEKQKANLEAEIRNLNKQLNNTKKNTKLTQQQLNALDKKIKERTKLINNINSQMGLLDKEIAHTQDSINVMRTRIDSLKNEYAKTIRVLYREYHNIDKAVLLFDTPEYNRSYLRLKYFNEYSRYRKQQAHYISEREREFNSVSLQLQRQKEEKSNLLQQEQKNKQQLTAEQRQKQQSVKDSKQKEKNLSAQLSKKEKQKRDLDNQIKKLIAEEVRKSAAASASTGKTTSTSTASSTASSTSKTTTTTTTASNPSAPSAQETALSSNFANNKGKFSWPVYYKSVLREYGRYTHSSGGENMNNGIDLATAPGASVYCIFNGTVTRVFTCPNGNKGVIVRHGEYMTVYANLATVSVKQGSSVTTKQVIGTVATVDGQGEFSFQLWKGTTPQNPRNWLRG